MVRILFIAIFAAASVSAFCADGDGKLETFRHSLTAIPQVSTAPNVDGEVDKREWFGASLLPGLVDSKSGIISGMRNAAYVSYDDKALYVSFQLPRSVNVPLTKADGDFSTDDCVEVRIDPAHDGKNMFSVVANALRASSDKVSYQARMTDYGWEGEFGIPFSVLGRDAPPAPGEVWGFDFINRQRTPTAETYGYSYGDKLSHIRFAGKIPSVRFLESGIFSSPFTTENDGGVELEFLNPGDKAEKVEISMELLRRKPGTAGGYLPGLAAGLTGAVDIVLATQDELLKSEMEKYEPVKTVEGTVDIPSKGRQARRIAVSEIGDYLVKYRVVKDGELLAAGVSPFVLAPPIRMDLDPYFLSAQIVEARVNFANVKEWQQGAKAQFSIVRRKGEAPLAQKEESFSGKSEFSVNLSLDKLEAGDYLVVLNLLAPDGSSLGSIEEGFRKPPTPEWFATKTGYEPVIPEPWKPIQASANEVSFLMGDYAVGAMALPSQVRVQSIYDEKRAALLSAPMVLKGQVNGKEIQWTPGTPAVDAKQPSLVEYSAQGNFEGLSLQVHTAFEYDGMAKVTLKLSPQTGTSPAVDNLCLEIPLSGEFAKLFQMAPFARRMQTDAKMQGGEIPRTGMAMEFTYSLWLGDEERGFRWFAENMKGWRLGANFANRAVEVVPDKSGVIMRINLIRDNQPFVVDKAREITFGYMFTPARSINPRSLNFGLVYENVQKEKEKGSIQNSGEVWFFPMQGWPVIPEGKLHEMKSIVEDGHKGGITVIPYGGWYVPRASDLYQGYGGEIITSPLADAGFGCSVCCWNTPMQDAYSALYSARISDLNIDGYRLDAGFTASDCNNLHHSGYGSICGYHDDDGKLQSSRALFAARRAAQRCYRLFHGGVKKEGGLVIQHVHQGNRYDFVLSHMDAVLSAEGGEMKMSGLSDFPQAFFRANVMGDAHGYQVIYMPKAATVGYDARIGLGVIHNMTSRANNGRLDMQEVSYSRCATSPAGAWAARDWIKPFDKGTELWGYWKNAAYVDTGNPELNATLQVQRGKKVLLSVLNLNKKPLMAAIKVNLKPLGFNEQVYAYDPVLHEAVKFENGEVTLPLTGEGYRLVEFSSQPFDVFNPEIIGENLLPEMDAANDLPAGWQAEAWVDEKDKTPPDAASLRIEQGEYTFTSNGKNNARISKPLELIADKPYMLEADVTITCDEGTFLGNNPDQNYFRIIFGEPFIYNMSIRTFVGLLPPGYTEKVRLYFVPGPLEAAEKRSRVEFWIRQAKGSAKVKNVRLYELKAAPPWSKRGQ